MFSKVTSEALGTSDICQVISPVDFAASPSIAYLLTVDGEQPYFILRSKKDEYCFTDRAMVHLDGESALSSKRLVQRYNYHTCEFRDVRIETAGTVDLDCEIKFVLGNKGFSLDVNRKQLTPLIALYKVLIAISSIQAKGNTMFELAKLALDRTSSSMSKHANNHTNDAVAPMPNTHGVNLVSSSNEVLQWLSHQYEMNNPTNFGPIFAKYISSATFA